MLCILYLSPSSLRQKKEERSYCVTMAEPSGMTDWFGGEWVDQDQISRWYCGVYVQNLLEWPIDSELTGFA